MTPVIKGPTQQASRRTGASLVKSIISRTLQIAKRGFGRSRENRGSMGSRKDYETSSQPWFVRSELPKGAAEYLRFDNPRLIELKEKYKGHPATVHSVWKDTNLQQDIDLAYFRGDNAYIWQTRQIRTDPLVAYALTTYYVKDVDVLGLLHRLEEDGAFGAVTFNFNDRLIVSRALLDSILEISFLERHLRISQMPSPTFLDIGAGYGRLAYRLTRALPNLKAVFCADAVPESTFLCEYYLKFRGVTDRAKAVPLYDIEETLSRHPIDIVTNIESFSECTIESITWWLDLIQKHGARYLMIVPDYRDTLLSKERDGRKVDFRPLIEARGFDLIAVEPIYRETSVSTYGLYPDRAYLLFHNRNALLRCVVFLMSLCS